MWVAVAAIWKLIAHDSEVPRHSAGDASTGGGDYTMASIAAGPLKGFIVRYGSPWLERIEAESRTNAKFRGGYGSDGPAADCGRSRSDHSF
jgi:hypothetical protein